MSDVNVSPFAALGLRESLLRTLATLGYEAPTPIQERTIPVLLAGRDLIGQAQTGTGKTAAFALPILEKIDPDLRDTQALVLTPTRELAMQVSEAIHSYAHLMRQVSVLPVYGGAPIVHQLKRLERGVHVVVGTPGRLIDHLDRKSLKLDKIRMIVLDEADEMLKMGFIDDVERILREAPKQRQIALFSATMPAEVMRIAQRHLVNPERVEIEHKTMTAPAIEQRFLNVAESQKLDALTNILELEDHPAVLIFRRTKNGAAELAEKLEARGFAAEAMHGDMNQSQRESVIRRLRSGNLEIVVATDVAARGLDVEQISHVVNYDIPYDVEAYVHRVGRTGRAGRTGVATLFITPRERRMMREIEKFTGTAIKPMKAPTRSDVAARRVTQLKDTIRKDVERGDLDAYVSLVEQMVEEGQNDLVEIAAAAVRLASLARPIAAGEKAEPESYASAPARPRDDEERAPASARPHEGRSRSSFVPDAPPRRASESRASRDAEGTGDDKVRLSMAVGKREGIRPADIVGSIANEADVPGREIGPIDIREEITYVTIPAQYVDQVLAKVARAKFRGKPVNVKVAGPGEGEWQGRAPRSAGRERPSERPSRYDDRKPSYRERSAAPAGRPSRFGSRDARGGEREARPAPRFAGAAGRAGAPARSGPRPSRPRTAGFGDEAPARRPPAKGGAFSRFAGPDRKSPRNDRGPSKGKPKKRW